MLSRVFNCVAFAIWVSICAAAPEFLWQGLLVFLHHVKLQDVLAALLIGTLLAFFIEPLMERIRRWRWRLEDGAEPAFIGLPISILFGLIAVCIHESVSAYVKGEPGQTFLARAFSQLPEWALVPFVVTVAWFSARARLPIAVAVGVLACAAVAAIGFYYEWGMQDVLTTLIPACALVVCGQWLVIREWRPETIEHLAMLTAAVTLVWFVAVWSAELVLWLCGSAHYRLYDYDEFMIDVRYYIGWSLGILLAPNPLRRRPGR